MKETHGQPSPDHDPDVLAQKNVRVEWVALGEGWEGDYDPDDPNDRELLRFDLSVWNEDFQEWDLVNGGSYCTSFPADSPAAWRRAGLEALMEESFDDFSTYGSARRACEDLSYMTIHHPAVVRHRIRDLDTAGSYRAMLELLELGPDRAHDMVHCFRHLPKEVVALFSRDEIVAALDGLRSVAEIAHTRPDLLVPDDLEILLLSEHPNHRELGIRLLGALKKQGRASSRTPKM